MPMTQKLWGFEMIQDRENVKTVLMLIRKIFMKKPVIVGQKVNGIKKKIIIGKRLND